MEVLPWSTWPMTTTTGGRSYQILVLILFLLEQALLDGDMDLVLDLGAEFLGHQGGGVEIDDIGDGVPYSPICINFAMTLPAF